MRSLFISPSLHNHPRSNRLLQQPSHCARNEPPPASCTHAPPAPLPSAAFRRRPPQGPGWQDSHRMHPFFAECAKKAPFLATSARNAYSSRSRWQHPRPMHPFPGAIGRFRMHGARILPPRALFRVEEPEITHGAKMLRCCQRRPAFLRQRPAVRPNGLCDTRHGRTGFAPCGAGLACLPYARPPAISPAFIAAVLCASRFAARIAPTARRHPPRRPLRSG